MKLQLEKLRKSYIWKFEQREDADITSITYYHLINVLCIGVYWVITYLILVERVSSAINNLFVENSVWCGWCNSICWRWSSYRVPWMVSKLNGHLWGMSSDSSSFGCGWMKRRQSLGSLILLKFSTSQTM